MAEFFTKAKYSTISQDTDQSPTPVPQEAPLPPPQHPGALSELVPRRDIPEGLWEKCKQCDETIFTREREQNWNICPKCGYHYPLPAPRRIQLLTDEGSFKEIDPDMTAIDTLKFEGVASYTEKLASNQKKTGMKDAVICGEATLNGIPYALGVMDFRFLGASMGAVVGEKITRLFEYATAKKLPLIIVTASGGARMYEGMISLMQMAKTSGAAERHKEAGLPYLVIMTHPTTAGVTASFHGTLRMAVHRQDLKLIIAEIENMAWLQVDHPVHHETAVVHSFEEIIIPVAHIDRDTGIMEFLQGRAGVITVSVSDEHLDWLVRQLPDLVQDSGFRL